MPGIEASTGSLRHGLPIGVGLAFAGKKDRKNYRVFVLMSDRECEESSVWEAAISASRLKLDNLIGIIDANKLQAYEKTDNIQPVSLLKGKFKNFGWSVREVDGHNFEQLEKVFKNIPFKNEESTRLIPYLIISCLRNKELKIFNPDAVRDFVFIEDVIKSYFIIVERRENLLPGSIFNIGSGKQYTVEEILKIIKKLTNIQKRLLLKETKNEEHNIPKIWKANIKKSKKYLNWTPEYFIEDGLKKTNKWFRDNLYLYQ